MITIETFENKIKPKLHGTTIGKLTNWYGNLSEGAVNMLARINPYTTIRRARIENAIYDKVYNYTVADDYKGMGNTIDIRPIGERSVDDSLESRFSKQFDIRKEFNTTTIEVINGVKTIRISKELTPRTIMHRCDSLTLEGTVTGGGDVTDLAIDTLDYISGSGSIGFNLSGATGAGTITFALTNSIDLTKLDDLGALFEWLKFPLASALTSVQLKWGSSASDYWTTTVTAAHDRAFEDNAFLLLRHDWNSATETGTPVVAEVDYIQVTINYTSGTARNGVKLDNITSALGEAYEHLYYSERLFSDTTGATWKEEPTLITDLIRMDNSAGINIFMYEVLLSIYGEMKNKNASKDIERIEALLNGSGNKQGLYDLYESKYPGQELQMQETYHDFDEISGY